MKVLHPFFREKKRLNLQQISTNKNNKIVINKYYYEWNALKL